MVGSNKYKKTRFYPKGLISRTSNQANNYTELVLHYYSNKWRAAGKDSSEQGPWNPYALIRGA